MYTFEGEELTRFNVVFKESGISAIISYNSAFGDNTEFFDNPISVYNFNHVEVVGENLFASINNAASLGIFSTLIKLTFNSSERNYNLVEEYR